MADFQLQWTIEGEQQLSRVLIGMGSNLKNYTRPFTQSADMLKKEFSTDVFDTQGASIGERWKRLSPYTVAQKAKQGFPLEPLIRTGKMKNSFQTTVSPDQAVVYNTAPYFVYHQSNKPREVIPRRMMMKLTNSLKSEIVRFFQQYILDCMHKNTL